jgi:hypothetical protein
MGLHEYGTQLRDGIYFYGAKPCANKTAEDHWISNTFLFSQADLNAGELWPYRCGTVEAKLQFFGIATNL